MDPLALVLTILLVIIFVVLIVGATRYYDNPTIASPLPLREPQIDPENELDLYVFWSYEVGQTGQNIAYNYKNTTIVLEYYRTEFNFSNPAAEPQQYLQSNSEIEVVRISEEISGQRALVAFFTKMYLGACTIGILRQFTGFKESLYSMIKVFVSSLSEGSEWILIFTPNQNLERFNNEFRIYPSILDPSTNEPFVFGIISSLNFNHKISVETITKIDKGLRLRMRRDDRIEEHYPETITNTEIVDQDQVDHVYDTAVVGPYNAPHSQEIIAQLFP
jgi:hypothetical protein